MMATISSGGVDLTVNDDRSLRNELRYQVDTGYLTALLCHRVGAENTTSIDIDPELM